MKRLYLWLAIFLSLPSAAETITFNGENVQFSIRQANYYQVNDKLSVDIEIELVNKRLPSKEEIAAVSEVVLVNYPKAKMTWVGYFLPGMPSNAGYYATDYRAPDPEGVKILDFMLFNTPYEDLVE
ncbi:hypothetical protein KP803_11765 [Vibrio sp. ZSDE26]|uniref:Uncharacterized protein n=1 Tax=Vibrio amylolyticus TaxID=2847292 RepID=A0A9X2BJZ4_9VIBR|nr:hypothetical protein [Vibrio amylolyticus]MCK6263947.1 hypothetical protein [Vibrio amylolyticus]